MQVNEDIGIVYSLSARSIYPQQMLKIHYQLESNDAFISLRIESRPHAGDEYIMLETRKTVLAETAGRRYRYDLNVLYSTSRSGKIDVNVPQLVYSEGGRDSYRFRFASQRIQVSALPPYLPPYIPMGRVEMESALSASSSWLSPLRNGKVYYWNITLKGVAVGAQSMPDIRQQIRTNRDIQFLPSDPGVTTVVDHDTVVQQHHYSIPFTPTAAGRVQLPEIRLQYFDVGKRRVVVSNYVPDGLIAMTPVMYWSIILIVVTVPLILLWIIRHPVQRAFFNLRKLYHARRQLQQANDAEQIRMAMNALGQAMGWPANLSVSQWQYYWQQNIGSAQDIRDYMHALSQKLYSADECQLDIAGMRSLLISTCLRQCKTCIRASL